jgi:hypothetical protein
MAKIQIFLRHASIFKVRELIHGGRKIQAIKLVRSEGKISDGTKEGGFRTPGLKESKHACDALSGIINRSEAEAVIAPAWRVSSLKVRGPDDEELEVDIDTLQMHFLTQLPSIGLDQTDRLLSLIRFIKEWQGDSEPMSDCED